MLYACPECGYEVAMLTNAYETQVVRSLGVRIGPADASASASEQDAPAVGTAGCPFTAMIPGLDGASAGAQARGSDPIREPDAVRWTAAAEARLAKIPEFVRPMARTGIERFARERGAREVDEQMLDAAREFFGM
jgi:hypothetical protein